jgi:hypothetical protein
MAIHYLDVDDEVTTAVARLRGSDEPHVALVLPAGSRVATSRINFRLLAREAAARDRRLAIVAPETSVRAISIAAGLPAYATVAAYEAALSDEIEREARERRGSPGGAGAHPGDGRLRRSGDVPAQGAAGHPGQPPSWPGAGETAPLAPAVPPASDVPRTAAEGHRAVGGETDELPAAGTGAERATPARTGPRSAGALPVAGPVRHEPGSGPRRRRLVALLVVLLLVAAGGAGAWLVLPSARIVVTPVGVVQGPISLQVTADPTATSVDQANLVVPAQQVSLPLSVQGTFQATGQKVNLTPATGSVTFTSNDTIDPVTIPAGTTVGTGAGVEFLTQTTVIAPRATVTGTTINPGRASTGVQAVTPGTAGNVPAHAIVVVPTRLQAFQVSVDNATATTGGTRTVTKVISQQDYDAAVKQLGSQIAAQLPTGAAEASLAPAGTTLIPATASLGTVTTAPAASALVGTPNASFQLTATATATVLAVSQQPLAGLAASRLQQQVPAGWSLFPDSIRTTVSDATVQDGHVTFTVTAQGERWHPVDPAALLAQVKGRSVADARTILQQYGEVSISTWPSFVSTIPNLDFRVSLTVAPPRRSGS